MIAIICQKGTIDAAGCRLDIIESSISYDLALINLDTKDEYVISQFSVKRQAEFTYQHIINAINERKPSVDIRDYEKMKSEIGDP